MTTKGDGLRLYFSTIIFGILTFSLLIACAMGLILDRALELEAVVLEHPLTLILMLYIVSLIISTAVLGLLFNRILKPITRLSDALHEVAQGNFDIQISENSGIDEMSSMYANFNGMVRELGTNETLRSDFISNVSHEFKTPITAIEGYATLLQDKSQSAQDRDECVEKILFNTRRLSDLVGNILLLSRIENQTITPERSRFLLNEQILQVLVGLEPKWTEKNIDFDVDMPKVRYEGFESMLMQVWSNIIGNAIKFSPPGGTVEISMKETEHAVKVRIRDHGPGMDADTKKHIFDKFYQGDTSHRSEGNGLGLALAQRIVSLSSGSISVESSPGEGAAFTVTLPRRILDKNQTIRELTT